MNSVPLNANEYSIQLHDIESLHQLSSEEKICRKISVTLQTIEYFIPNLSLLSNLFKLILEELNVAIYSGQYTSNGSNDVQKIPYSVLYNKLLLKRNEEVNRVQVLLGEVVQKLELKTIESNKLELEVTEKQLKIHDAVNKNRVLQNNLDLCQVENKKLLLQITALEGENSKLKNRLKSETDKSTEDFIGLKKHLDEVIIFKDAHDKLNNGFIKVLCPNKKVSKDNATIEKSKIIGAERIKFSLNEMRNRFVNEFDVFLNEQTLKTVSRKDVTPINDELKIKKKVKKLFQTKWIFLQNIKKIIDEVNLLNEQQCFENSRQNEVNARDNNDCEDQKKEFSRNPFIPQNDTFNKYSFMLYGSVNEGRTFMELPGALFCFVCNERSYICLHTPAIDNVSIKLPKDCTVVKLIRPMKTKIGKHFNGTQPQNDSNSTEHYWVWFYNRFKKPATPFRCISLDNLLKLIYELYAYVFYTDENNNKEWNKGFSFLDFLYEFIKERYFQLEIVEVVIYEVLKSLEENCLNSQELQLFGLLCNKKLDASVCRYLSVMTDLIQCSVVANIDDVMKFMNTVYSFLTEDELELLKIDFISFSNNRASETFLYNYILHLIIVKKEPRFIDSLSAIRSHPVRYDSLISEMELMEMIETNVLALPAVALQKRLFANSLAGKINKEYIDQLTASQIFCYLNLKADFSKLAFDLRGCAVSDFGRFEERRNGCTYLKLFFIEFDRRRYINKQISLKLNAEGT